MADSKTIDLAIKARDLASKPIQDIGAAVDKLVSAVGDLAPASEKGAKNLGELTSTAGQLQKAMQGLKADAALIESYTALSDKVEAASSNLKKLQETSAEATLALSNATKPSKAMQQAATASAAAATRQEKALGGLVTRLDTLKAAMAGAGIDFNNLAVAQEKIDAAFNTAAPAYARINEAIDQYSANQRKAAAAIAATAAATAESNAMAQRFTDAMHQEGAAAGDAAKQHGRLTEAFASFRGEGGKALSLYQELRTGLVGMAAQFLGVFGAIQALRSGFESIESLEGSKSILTQSFGATGAGEQLEYIKGQADRLSLSYIDLTRNYAKFSAAAAGSGADQSQTRQIFETFAEAARVKNLSAEQQSSIFEGLDKIFSKDQVGATELFRKLSTDLPEAAAIFRKSIDTLDGTPLTTDQFERLLKSGKVTAAFVAKFAADYRASFADQLPAATNTTTAALAQFQNSWDQFKISVLEGGALDAFRDALLKMTAFFKSEDGKKFASELAEGAQLAAKGIGLVVDHIGELKTAAVALGAVWAANFGRSVYADLMKLVGAFSALAANINTAFETAPLLSKVLGGYAGVLASGLAGFKIGEWLNSNFASVRQFGVLLVGYYETVFEAIKSIGKAAWAFIFDSASFKQAAAQAASEIAAVHAELKDQYTEAGKEPGPAAASGESLTGSGAATATAMTPRQKADAALAAQTALNDELFDAAKSLQTRLSEMRGELVKKDATDLKSYLAGLSESFKPLYAEIDKLKQDFPHNSQALVDKLTAQLNAIKALTLTDAANKFDIDKAKRGLEDITAAVSHRDQLVSNQSRKASEGVQSPEQSQRNIAGITATANPAILANLQKLQGFIATLPADVQTKLQATTDELKLTLDKLEERPATNVLKDIKTQEDAINQALELRDAKMEAVKQQAAVGLFTTQQEKTALAGINDEYGKTIDQAKALIVYIQTSVDLTDDQRKALEGVVAKMEIAVASAKKTNDAIYPATKVADDLAQGGVNIAAAFAKAAASGKGLGGAFTSAWQAFKAFASDFLLKIGEMIVKQELMNALGFGGAGGSGSGGGIAGIISKGVSWLTGGAASSAAGAAASGAAASGAASAAATSSSLLDDTLAATFHSGGTVGGSGVNRRILAAAFRNAARMHSGGKVAGLQPNEMPAILEKGERVLSRAQVAAGMGAGQQSPQHIQVNNLMDHEDIVRRGLAAPSNVRVITNIIRANRTGIKQALA